MKLSGAQITIKQLERCGINIISGIPGGSNLPIYDAILDSNIKSIITRHEQGAAFIAQGMARSTGKAAVCFATSGPGATNLITGIADAMADSIPIVAITGQVPTSLIGTNAFQEVDFIAMTKSICKKCYAIKSADELITAIPEAIKLAESGRPGPVVIDIPKDIQNQIIEFDSWPEIQKCTDNSITQSTAKKLESAAKLINSSERPLMFIGGGAIHSESTEDIIEIAHKNNIPVITSLMGIGAFPSSNQLNLGMIGMHGKKSANMIMHESDTIIALGVRFGDRSTGNTNKFCPGSKIIHIDIDTSEIDKNISSYIGINCDLKAGLEHISPLIESNTRSKWLSQINGIRIRYDLDCDQQINLPRNLFNLISEVIDEDTIITTDVGQHQMWAAQYGSYSKPRSFLTSGGIGTMGFGLPAAIGAALANPDKKIVCISGDGSIQMNIQELATMAEHNLNISLIIINNQQFGMVKQQQELFFNARYSSSRFATSPDFSLIAQGYGIYIYHPAKSGEYSAAISAAINHSGPCVIDLPFDDSESVFPIVPPGSANTDPICGESKLKEAS
ncbi:MAG: biosynthetic-type acetolactate synthase large subunit [Gammaproteobacteria bacterium]|nr:MAG: biosynthetic-type acetolactate synthase large subunit [Gammaproteobacteria bacterium]